MNMLHVNLYLVICQHTSVECDIIYFAYLTNAISELYILLYHHQDMNLLLGMNLSTQIVLYIKQQK